MGVPRTQVLFLAHRHTMMMNVTVATVSTATVDRPTMTGRVKTVLAVGVGGGEGELGVVGGVAGIELDETGVT